MEPEFIEATPAARRKVILFVAVGLAVGAALQLLLKPWFFAYVNALPLCDRIRWLQSLLIGVLVAMPAFSLWAVFYGRRLLKARQWPLPDAWVWRRTPVVRGRPATLRAYALIGCACMTASAPFLGWYLLSSAGMLSEPLQCRSTP